MSRSAPRVHADQAVIARMEQFAQALPQDSRVELRTDRGECFRGMVSATPMQVSIAPTRTPMANTMPTLGPSSSREDGCGVSIIRRSSMFHVKRHPHRRGLRR